MTKGITMSTLQPAAPVAMSEIGTIGELLERGRASAGPAGLAYAMAGAGEELTVARNREALRRLAFQPRILRDVSHIDTETTVVGLPLAMPIMLAPVGALALFDDRAAASSAIGAAQNGTAAIVGMLAEPGYDEVVRDAGTAPFFQLAPAGDRDWILALLSRVETAGCRAVCLTVDGPVLSRRDRLIRQHADHRIGREREPSTLLGLGRDRAYQARFTWTELEWLRAQTALPLILKGVMHPDDARRAVDSGVDAVYVSNHGGRHLDHALSTIEVLPSIVAAVAGSVDVLVDGGFRRGSDVVKAIALGARAALLGRMQCWALAAGGADGVKRLLELVADELRITMALLGCVSLAELTPDCLQSTFSPPVLEDLDAL
jgi:isopentenyl diphosphate isomerase/L-lactate dehydrogenase-like FMN-dependent dehydrogenase